MCLSGGFEKCLQLPRGIILLANLFIVTIILELVFRQLATSGKLVDTVRYAWRVFI